MKELTMLLDKLGLVGMKMQLTEGINLIKGEEDNSNNMYDIYGVLKKLLEAECEYKKSRSLEYRLKVARFPAIKLLSDTSQAGLIGNIDIGNIIDKHENIILIGGSGSGKTHLAIGLGFAASQRSYRVRFYTLNELATLLLNAKAHNNESKVMESIMRFHLIIVDELGYIPIKAEARALLFELFGRLYEQTSLIITTYLRFEEWGEIFGNPKATKAIIDRITHHCRIVETGNKSFRGRKDVK
jgi:DNA replication protein DnaC